MNIYYQDHFIVNFSSSSLKPPLAPPLTEASKLFKQIMELHKNEIETLKKTVKKQENTNLLKKIQQSLDRVSALKDSTDHSAVFEVESQIREILNFNDFPGKQQYQDLYENKMLLLLNQVKQSITQRPFHFTVQAAAAKGQAARAGLQALNSLSENQPLIENSGVSLQEVFLLPTAGVVFKRSDSKAEEEEKIVNHLFDLMSKNAVVGTFNIQCASTEKFGIQVPFDIRKRSFTMDDLSQPLLFAIKQKLSDKDCCVVEKYEKSSPKNKDLCHYKEMKKKQWRLKFPEEAWKYISFSELQQLYLRNQIPEKAKIQGYATRPTSFYRHILIGTPLFRALDYFPTLQNVPQNFYLSPDLSFREDKEAYEFCEKFKWAYTDEIGKEWKVEFKDIHTRFLLNKRMTNIHPLSSLSPSSSSSLPMEINREIACNVDWKVISPQLMYIQKNNQVEKLTNIQAKPFIGDMLLMENLRTYPSAREAILNKLIPKAEFNAILTGELQLLDLHPNNLGVAPEPNTEYERFKDLQFLILPASSSINFKKLIIQYLAGKIPPNQVIEFKENGQTIRKTLQDLPDLQKALDVHWQFVIFDTDLSLSEDNCLQLQITLYQKEAHLIPLRSALLETEWKDRPLSQETVQLLLDHHDRDLRVKQWVNREDAPIYKRLSPSAREQIASLLDPILIQYNLSETRKKGYGKTVKELQHQFSLHLSDVTQPSCLAIWEKIEEDLSSVTIRPHDTLKEIAKRYQQDIEELKGLNSKLNLQPGEKVKIKYDLTSHSPKASERRAQIALQLFPRLTVRQKNALFERMIRRVNYLTRYQDLLHSSLEGEALINQMKQFLQEPETPLSFLNRENLLKELQKTHATLLSHPQDLLNFKKSVCEQCQPTYFNLMKAMYPLLADTYALNELVYGKENAGVRIGHYSCPLEKTIADVKKSAIFSHDPKVRLANRLEEKIAMIQDSFFF